MGGDHKCPLCSATFTRPQHVGRHLRAHTGDRPYECKECPLRFARSDLLSRHVNKAHPKPNGVHDNKHEKKGRSKSLSTVIAPSRPPMSFNVASSLPHQPEPTAYQAQRMYPNHPLLQQNHSAAPWATGALDLSGGGGVANFNMGLGGSMHLGPDVIGSLGNATTSGITFLHPFGGHPITYAASPESSLTAASGYDLTAGLAAGGPLATTLGYELNTKKRACDQCNHSKVRCDFADPCARCNHRHVQCTYTKPQRSARARNVTYPIPNVPGSHLTTSPNHRTQSLGQSPTTMMFASSPSSYSRPQDNDAVSMARHASEQSTASSDFLVSDTLSASTERIRPPVPETNWDNAGALHPRSQSMSNAPSSISQGGFISQSPSSALGLALTPTLTSDTSPSLASDGTDRHGSQGSINTSNWALPPSILSQKSAIKFVNSFVAQQNGDNGNGLQGNPQFAWPNHPGGIDTSMLPVESALSVSSDGATPPESHEEDETARRRSSMGVWANALKEMHIDDTVGPSMALDNTLEQLPFDMNRDASSSMDKNVSNPDLNLWKLFLDPGALATPDRMQGIEFNQDTPRGLNKSNSAPDLTTPLTNFPNPMEMLGDKESEDDATEKGKKRLSRDDQTFDRWKDHIQMRHASFSMNPDAEATVRTRALTNATFASSIERQLRPSLHPLMQPSSGDATLAPERLPSFGPAAFDLNGVLLTPGYRGPKTPTKLFSMYTATDARPSNKRQASQTLIGDMQKRSTFLLFSDEDEATTSEGPSRRGSAPGLPAALNGKTGNLPQNLTAWQAADVPRAC